MLVPILERLLEHECGPEDAEDFRFMDMLLRARALPRRDKVFSPSMLGSCMRQTYFAKRGVEKHRVRDAQTNGYFLTGNFTHFKWQFAMWKAHRAGMLELATIPIGHEVDIIMHRVLDGRVSEEDGRAWMDALNLYGDATRPGVEVRVVDEDYGGTIDVLAHFPTPETSFNTHVIDFKGVNQIEFQRTVKKGAKTEYRRQIVGYAGIANKVLALDPPVENCLLVSENKPGPMSGVGSPLALHETIVRVADFEGEVARRLRTMRHYDHKDRTPEPECVSTQHMSFQGCAFKRFCVDEVKQTQRERERAARERQEKLSPARPRRE